MPNRLEVEKIIKKYKSFLKEQYAVKKIGIFGSYARNEQREDSDIDIIVELDKPIGLKFVDLKFFLEEKLGRRVDLVTPNAIRPQMREQIFKEVVYQ